MISNIDKEQYFYHLRAVASMSRLYSSSKIPFLHAKFVEILFTKSSLTKANLIANQDKSFDCILENKRGVGIKTFICNGITKTEKVAEFNKQSPTIKNFDGDEDDLFLKYANERNMRISSDVKEYGIDLQNSFYHCLIRVNGGAYIHEEPYELIDIDRLERIGKKNKYPFYSDGKSEYNFNTTKSTLNKTFKLKKLKNREVMQLPILSEEIVFKAVSDFYNNLKIDDFIKEEQKSFKFYDFESKDVENLNIVKSNEDFVVLPLYGTTKKMFVEEKSGINAWNGGGRKRKFGEVYIPIPAIVHKIKPNFFPSSDKKFTTKLPNGVIINTKISSGSKGQEKGLGSNPLTELCTWLFELIDIDLNISKKRFQTKDIYTYKDLLRVGKDSLKIIKVKNKDYDYEMHTMPLGSFEEFKISK